MSNSIAGGGRYGFACSTAITSKAIKTERERASEKQTPKSMAKTDVFRAWVFVNSPDLSRAAGRGYRLTTTPRLSHQLPPPRRPIRRRLFQLIHGPNCSPPRHDCGIPIKEGDRVPDKRNFGWKFGRSPSPVIIERTHAMKKSKPAGATEIIGEWEYFYHDGDLMRGLAVQPADSRPVEFMAPAGKAEFVLRCARISAGLPEWGEGAPPRVRPDRKTL